MPIWRTQRGHLAADLDERARAVAAQDSDRHPVDVAARRQRAGIEVGVRIEPDHAQLALVLAALRRDGADRADSQAMVAAEQQRQPAGLQFGAHRRVHREIPRDDLAEVAVAVDRPAAWVGRPGEVAPVGDLETQALQYRRDAGDA
jgi:hypothetical protein